LTKNYCSLQETQTVH